MSDLRTAAQMALDALLLEATEPPIPETAAAIDALRAALAADPKPVAWADECRMSLVTALHFLASDFENALYKFDGDEEALRAASGSIAHARKIALRWNWNGAAPTAQPLTDEQIGAEWTPCVKLPVTVYVRQQRPGETHVSTREGITPIKPDDLIMRGVAGEEYPIGRDVFNRTYRIERAHGIGGTHG